MTLPKVAHDKYIARQEADQVVLMHAQRIREMGSTQLRFNAPQTAELTQFTAALY